MFVTVVDSKTVEIIQLRTHLVLRCSLLVRRPVFFSLSIIQIRVILEHSDKLLLWYGSCIRCRSGNTSGHIFSTAEFVGKGTLF